MFAMRSFAFETEFMNFDLLKAAQSSAILSNRSATWFFLWIPKQNFQLFVDSGEIFFFFKVFYEGLE